MSINLRQLVRGHIRFFVAKRHMGFVEYLVSNFLLSLETFFARVLLKNTHLFSWSVLFPCNKMKMMIGQKSKANEFLFLTGAMVTFAVTEKG